MNKGLAIITGGCGGIGKSVISRLQDDGFTTMSWDLHTSTIGHHALTVNVTDEKSLQNAAIETLKYGEIRALIINAGIRGSVGRAWELSADEIQNVINTNLVSAFLTLRAVVPHMLTNPGPDRGKIVLMSSLQAKEGTVGAGPYAASKAGMIGLTKVIGKELATDGILVNAVTPTVVRTPMEQNLTPDRRGMLLSKIPMNRFAEADEVAAMVSWLCSSDCSFSTGAVFDVSGGRATS